MRDDRLGGITQEKLEEQGRREKPDNRIEVTQRWSFGPKGFKSISLIGDLIRKIRELWNSER